MYRPPAITNDLYKYETKRYIVLHKCSGSVETFLTSSTGHVQWTRLYRLIWTKGRSEFSQRITEIHLYFRVSQKRYPGSSDWGQSSLCFLWGSSSSVSGTPDKYERDLHPSFPSHRTRPSGRLCFRRSWRPRPNCNPKVTSYCLIPIRHFVNTFRPIHPRHPRGDFPLGPSR